MELLQYCAMVFLLYALCDIAVGVEDFTVQFESQKTCFEENTGISIAVEYTGAGTPDILQWKFSKMTDMTKTLDIITAICTTAAGADPAFPESRMSYTCDNTLKKYTTTIANFTEATDAGTWKVALSVSASLTNFLSVTVEKCQATTVEMYNCPGLGNSTAVDSGVKCGCAWFGICCGSLLVVLFFIGLCCGCSLEPASVKEGKSCEDCVNNRYCRCECFASTPCGACCNIKGLPYWYQVLWASVVGSTVAFGIWLAWRPRKNANEPGGNDSTNNSSGDVPLNTKYSN